MKFLITGGTGFIGQCVVRNVLRRGIAAVAADQLADEDLLDGLRAEARLSGAGFDFAPMDVSDFRDVTAVFHKHPDITHTNTRRASARPYKG